MSVLFANNAATRLASAIIASDTSLSVSAGDGAKFPAPTGGDWFPVTLLKADGTLEIAKCTARTGDVLTVTRGQEGTTALAFAANDRVELRITAAVMTAMAQAALYLPLAGGTLSGDLAFSGAGRRILGDFSNTTLSSRAALQTSSVNGMTMVPVLPNGTSTTAGIQAMAASDPTNSPYLAMYAGATEQTIDSGKNGTGAYQPLRFLVGGIGRFIINTNGQVEIRNDANGYGLLTLSSADGTTYKRWVRLNTSSAIEFVNKANTSVTHTFADNGWATLTGGLSAASGTAGGYAQVYRSKDGSNNKSAWLLESESGMGAAVSHFPTVGSHFSCNSDAAMNLGWSLTRWNTLWASTGTIQTSDAREKTPVRPLNDAELSVAKVLAKDIGIYQWLQSIEEKGVDGARLFCGQTVQFIIQKFTDAGLDWHRYSFICYDECVDGIEAVHDDDGNVIREAIAPGTDIYSLRYDGLLMFISRGLAENQRLLEARIAALEAK